MTLPVLCSTFEILTCTHPCKTWYNEAMDIHVRYFLLREFFIKSWVYRQVLHFGNVLCRPNFPLLFCGVWLASKNFKGTVLRHAHSCWPWHAGCLGMCMRQQIRVTGWKMRLSLKMSSQASSGKQQTLCPSSAEGPLCLKICDGRMRTPCLRGQTSES